MTTFQIFYFTAKSFQQSDIISSFPFRTQAFSPLLNNLSKSLILRLFQTITEGINITHTKSISGENTTAVFSQKFLKLLALEAVVHYPRSFVIYYGVFTTKHFSFLVTFPECARLQIRKVLRALLPHDESVTQSLSRHPTFEIRNVVTVRLCCSIAHFDRGLIARRFVSIL